MNDIEKNSVLIVDDERSNIIALTHILGQEYTVYVAKNGLDAIEVAKEYLPDVILLDILMPEMDGFEVFSLLRNEEETSAIPVIFVTGLGDAENEEKGLNLGAADYISKPYNSSVVRLRVTNQIKMVNQIRLIEHLSTTDQLTGLPNRRSFNNHMNKEWGRSVREKLPISILILDVDHFKMYNDTYGHQQGDVALKTVADTITKSLKRSYDFAARWGGEEFIVILPNTDLNGALEIAEKIRINNEEAIIAALNGKETKITVSIGVSTLLPALGGVSDDIILQADTALYEAKKNGRNRVYKYES